MAITFALLMNPRVLNGLPFHEIAGLLFGVAILTHIGLNFQWVKNTTFKIFNSDLPKKTRFNFLLNILLLVSMSAIIITGILISKVVFPDLAMEGNRTLRGLHDLAANLTLALVGLHIGVHWQWILSICNKMFKSKEGKWSKRAVASVALAIAILAGGLQWYASTSSAQTIFDVNQMQQNSQLKTESGTAKFQPNGDFLREHRKEGDLEHRRSANSFLVILTYFGLFGAIIVPTYYLDKKIIRKKSLFKNIMQSE